MGDRPSNARPRPHGSDRQQRDVDRVQVRLARVGLRRLAEEDLRQEAGEADRDEVDHDARHDLVDPERHRGERVDRREQRPGDHADHQMPMIGPHGRPQPRLGSVK